MAKQRTTGFGSWIGRLFGRGGTVIPVVRLNGVIASDPRPGRLNIANVEPLLERAFRLRRAPA